MSRAGGDRGGRWGGLRINEPTFWGEAEGVDVAVVPVQGCVRVLFPLVEVSPERMAEEGHTPVDQRENLTHGDKCWTSAVGVLDHRSSTKFYQ